MEMKNTFSYEIMSNKWSKNYREEIIMLNELLKR